jgi:hypothetical protein
MLPVRLDPMQTQCMQKRRKALHDAQNEDREREPDAKHNKHREGPENAGRAVGEHAFESHAPQHLTELGMCEGEGPKAKVGGRVGNAAKAELDGVNNLMNGNLAKLEALGRHGQLLKRSP